jgi:tRNA(Ile)-lysidine synthase
VEVLKQVRNTIRQHELFAFGEDVVVGVSGGPDSLCLLHILRRLQKECGLGLHVAHLNHRLRGAEADADAQYVAHISEAWGLPVHTEAQDVAALAQQRKLAIEEAARQARYAFLARTALRVGARKIAVGHNADDQVETVLMHWLRGSGLAGLRGMQFKSKLGTLRLRDEDLEGTNAARELRIIRPLLQVRRADVEAYCAAHDLEPRFDRSNLDTTYYRNRLRHELLPFLETFNPRIREVILRSASVLAADYDYLRQQRDKAWAHTIRAEGDEAIAFDLTRLRGLSTSLQRSIIREAIHRLRRSLRNIDWVHVENALVVLQEGTTGMTATLPRQLKAQVGYDRLWVCEPDYVEPTPDLPLIADLDVKLQVPGRTRLPQTSWSILAQVIDRHELDEADLQHDDPWRAYFDFDVAGPELQLRNRRPGDRFWPQGLGDRATKLGGFMTNAKIPNAWRDRIPLLVSPQRILWLAGWRIDEQAKVGKNTRRVLVIRFQKALDEHT